MKSSAAVLFAAAVAWAAVSSAYARGIILTAPRTMEKNAVNKLYMNLYDVDAAGTVSISLRTSEGNSLIAGTLVTVERGESEKVIELRVPESAPAYEGRIWVNGTFDTSDRYSIYEVDEVYFSGVRRSVITFIQTDKPIYKPAQEVKFRILPLDRNLKPLSKDTKGEVWIEDSARRRIAQWKDVSFGLGIRQFEFPLSEEPPLGKWKINTRVGDVLESTFFEVMEYVLPKFEVTVTPPSFVLADVEIIPFEICAKYTYGKHIQGSVQINSTLETYSYGYEKFPVLQFEDKIDGCYTYQLNVTLLDENFNHIYRKITVTAEVSEEGTDVKRTGSVNVERTYNALTLQFVDDKYSQYFKPGMPYDKKIKVTKPDNTAAPNEEIEVCATIKRERVLQQWWATREIKYCKNYTADEYGIVLFQVPPPTTDAVRMELQAKTLKYGDNPSIQGRPKLYQPMTTKSVQPYYSPSKSYIQIQNFGETLQCGTSRNVKVLYTAQEGQKYAFHYQVISKGEVIQRGSKEVLFSSEDYVADAESMCKGTLSVNDVQIALSPSEKELEYTTSENFDCSPGQVGSVEIDVDVTAALSPTFDFLVYYIRDDDETVADSAKFQTEKCFQNKVEFQFGDEEKPPGAKTSITLKASPNSLCGTKVVDKSINLLGSSGQLTKEVVFEALKKSDWEQRYWVNHCNDKFRKGGKNKTSFAMLPPQRSWSSSQHVDAFTAFEDTGFVVLSDLTLFSRPCSGRDHYYGGHGGYVAYSLEDSDSVMETAEARIEPIPLARPPASPRSPQSGLSGPVTKSVVDVRSFFPETWLFDMESVGESGELVSEATLPHTITDWIGNAVCINEADGLGVSDTASVRGFQAFFLEFTLPYSVIRGERVPLTISIFNYLDKCLPVTRMINVLGISDNGTVMSESSTSADVCICGGRAETFKYMFTPNHIGTLNLTVLAESTRTSNVCGDNDIADVEARDMAAKSLRVEAEGFPQDSVNSFMFCPEGSEGSTYNSRLVLNVPDNAVEGSERAFIFVSGSIMGPAIDGLDHLVRLPTGCGEQNMVLFTPNIVALDYLTSVGELTEAIKSKAIKNLQTGYQRELKYRHWDGSYSAFGGGTDVEGSMWLSAFVLKSFSQAKRYIYIDERDIRQTVDWILQKQQPDGCFPKVGMVFSQGMKGGLASHGESATAALTAYVLTALLTSEDTNGTVISRALACIKSATNLTPYTAALYGYATALAEDSEADRYLEWLSENAITSGDQVYWINTYGSTSLDVETAAYAILTILKRKGDQGLSQALPIVRRLTTMRNANGGFVSTQDTVVGLEAIALFASKINQGALELTVKLNGGMLDETVVISEDNKLVVKKNRVPVVPSTVEVTATGTGCGLLQTAIYYNTLRVQGQRFFSINVNATRRGECKRAAINVCVSYLPQNQKSNMALVEIKMVSGFVAVQDTLQRLLRDTRVNLKRFEIENNNVILYFEELSNDNSCFTFDLEEVIPVENSKPGIAKVYDYYAKEKEETADYSIAGGCSA